MSHDVSTYLTSAVSSFAATIGTAALPSSMLSSTTGCSTCDCPGETTGAEAGAGMEAAGGSTEFD